MKRPVGLPQAIAEMEALLVEEADCLRNGSLENMKFIISRKHRAWDALQQAQGTCEPVHLRNITLLAQKNAKLLLAARSGIDAVQKLRTSLGNGPAALSTYNAKGKKSVIQVQHNNAINSRSV